MITFETARGIFVYLENICVVVYFKKLIMEKNKTLLETKGEEEFLKMSFEDTNIARKLFGPRDENIKYLKKYFNVKASIRGNYLMLVGEKNEIENTGKVVQVVNTASYCGFTGQYKGLESLYSRYQGRGLVVLGFPSNDFGRQEPGSAKEIAAFCENTFGVKFPMFSKTAVLGPQAHPLYRQLATRTGEAPGWNFHKYLIDRQGQVVRSFSSQTEPENPAFVMELEKLLSQKI